MMSAKDMNAAFDAALPRLVVELDEKNVYGNLLRYPHNELARALAEFRGTATFTPVMVEQLKAMGMSVVIVGTNARTL
jgi:hypothetical protein